MAVQPNSTRREFLLAVYQSWAVRFIAYMIAGLVIAKVVISLWPQRFWIGTFFASLGCCVVIKSVIYAFSGTATNERALADCGLTKTYWGYEIRGTFWLGFGLAMGSVIAFLNTGTDPIAGFVVGVCCCALGIVAHVAASRHSAHTSRSDSRSIYRSSESRAG